jgi:biotin-dependent carboxylase-like uncharacterized protein
VIVIQVLDGGLFTTVQDLGRAGWQRYGVPPSGAMDRSACLAANALVGNPPGAAVLEMTLAGPRLEFTAPATVALAGADLGAHLDDEPAVTWQAFTVAAGQTLWFTGPEDGARAYLAVAGGIDVPMVLGSRSTYARSRFGGLAGRPLATGDRLVVSDETARTPAGRRHVPPHERPAFGHDHVIRVLRGPQDDRFTAEGMATFLSSAYVVGAGADRMGYRLRGPAVAHTGAADIVSDGSPLGGVQVAGDGQPIVLMVDRGTAGGYAKIATVITVDTWRLAQAASGDTVRFREVTLAEAHAALRARTTWLERIAASGGRSETDGRPRPSLARRKRAAAAAVAAVASYVESLRRS